MDVSAVFYDVPPVGSVDVTLHMFVKVGVQVCHIDTIFSSDQLRKRILLVSCIRQIVSSRNGLVRWSLELARQRYPHGHVHSASDNHFVSQVKSREHVRTFLGSCCAELLVPDILRDRIRVGYLGAEEILGHTSAGTASVSSAAAQEYYLKCPGIPYGVNFSAFHPSSMRSVNPTILFFEILGLGKQGRRLLGASIHDARKNITNAEFWIFPDFTPVDHPGVKVYGSVSQDQLNPLSKQARFFWLPSKYEAFGVPCI